MKNFLALNASAGSGKTFALSTRFIALILSGASIGEITALTFTKKAANEMKERIIKTFLNLQSGEKSSEREMLAEILSVSGNEIIALRDKFLHQFLEANLKISTFDAFFCGILRQFSLHLGLSPDFSINNRLQTKQQLEFVRKIEQDSQLLKAFARFIVQSQSGQGSFFDALDMLYENFDRLNAKKANFPDGTKVLATMAKMREFAELKGGSKTAIDSFSKLNINEIIKSSFLEHESLDYKTYSKIYSQELDELFFELKNRLKEYFDELEAYKINELDWFLQIYKKTKFELNKKLNMFSFSDVSRNVYELLCVTNVPTNMLYFKLDGRINHLLIDEFQDTNVTQYEIMKPIIGEIVSGFGQNGLGSFFYVGDTKQSIYRFRGGKKELFDKLRFDFRQIQSDNLKYNYRSHKALVKFTNAIFNNKITNFIPQIPKKTDDNLKWTVNEKCDYFDAKSDDFGYLCVTSGDDVAQKAVEQVKNLLNNGVNDSDITILCWKNDDINTLADLLEKDGINSVNEGSLALIKSPFARAVVEYAKFCLFKDEIYRLNVMKILDISELEVLEIEPNLSASVALYHLANILKVAHNDVLILIEEAQKFNTLSEFIFNLDDFDVSAGANSKKGVNIMTVFKSKGLEFNHVIVCDKMGRGNNNGSNFLVEYDVKKGWEIRHNAKKEIFDDEFKRLKCKIKDLDKEEDLNKIYVAFTRAICSLIIIKKASPNGLNPSFFTAYELSNSKQVEYLDLKNFTFGKIIPSNQINTTQKVDETPIFLPNVARQKVDFLANEHSLNFDAIYFGLALHFMLEMTENFDIVSLQRANFAMRNKFNKFLSSNALDDVEKRAKALMQNERFLQIISGKRILKEQPLRFNGSLKQVDLLCVGKDEICVIDYKTSKSDIDANLEQISWYKQAVGEIYGKKDINAFLFYVLKDEISVIKV